MFSSGFTGINNLFKLELEMRKHIISTFKWKVEPLCYFGKKEGKKTFAFIKEFLSLAICYRKF